MIGTLSSRSSQGPKDKDCNRKRCYFYRRNIVGIYPNKKIGERDMLLLFVQSTVRMSPGHIMYITNSGIYLENNWSRPVPIHTISPRFIDGQVARYETPKVWFLILLATIA